MGKRGRKPINMGLLDVWEFEWWKAFHMLRDGTPLPTRYALTLGLASEEAQAFLAQLKRMTAEQYWRTERRLAAELGEKVNLNRPPTSSDLRLAEQGRAAVIRDLARTLGYCPHCGNSEYETEADQWQRCKQCSKRWWSPGHQVLAERREIWNCLVRARTRAALLKACESWDRLPDVRGEGMQCYPTHVLANEKQFFLMKRNKRFPRSGYGDDARLDYLARGMAGVMADASPLTAIERLRNMKHDSSGLLWRVEPGGLQYCGCWRCGLKPKPWEKPMRDAYANGLRLFMEVATQVMGRRKK